MPGSRHRDRRRWALMPPGRPASSITAETNSRSHDRADLPGYELVVTVAELFGFTPLT